MKAIKALVLVALAACSSMALLGSDPAAASDTITVCKLKVESSKLCPAGELEPAGMEIQGKAVNPILQGALEEKCGESKIGGKTTVASGSPLTGSFTEFSMTGSCTPCSTVHPLSIPYGFAIGVFGVDLFFVDFVFTIDLLNCFGFINCKFSTPESGASLAIDNNGGHPIFTAEKETLVGPGGLCGSTATFTAKYALTAPKDGWFALDAE